MEIKTLFMIVIIAEKENPQQKVEGFHDNSILF